MVHWVALLEGMLELIQLFTCIEQRNFVAEFEIPFTPLCFMPYDNFPWKNPSKMDLPISGVLAGGPREQVSP